MQIDIRPLFNPGKIKADSRAAKLAIEKATVSALNKLATQGMNQGRRAMTDTYNIKAKDIRPAIKVVKASRTNQVSVIRARGETTLPVYKFGGLPKAPASQKGIKSPFKGRKKASAKILKKGQRVKYDHAFVAKMGSNISIYERTSVRSLPVRRVTALGIPAMFERTAIKAVDELITKKGQDIFAHELDFQMKKAGLKT